MARLAEVRASKLAMERDRDAGELVYAADVIQTWNIGMNRIRTRLESLPDELESLLPDEMKERVSKDVTSFITVLLAEMANWEPIELRTPEPETAV